MLKCGEACKIDIIERLPTPYGLIRGGVAPDHQTTKRVARNYEKMALADKVNYYGNVAIDCARVLLRTPRGMSASDLPDHVGDVIHSALITDVHMVGRRGPVDAKFTNVELREMGKLTETVPQMRSDQLPDSIDKMVAHFKGRDRRLKESNLNSLAEFAQRAADEKPKRIHFEFYAQPVAIMGGKRVERVRFERTEVNDGRAIGTGETFDIDCGLVIAAIGCRANPIEGAPYDEKQAIIPNDEGRVDDGLYAVGWIKRGPAGVISSNPPDGEMVAHHIKKDFARGGSKPGREAFQAALKERGVRSVNFGDWKRIDELEQAAADGAAPRRKFVTVEEMRNALNGGGKAQATGV